MPRPFLTARWTNLFLATYAVPSALVQMRLPPGLELDTRDGQAFVSLVAFEFHDTRVLGVSWPGYRNFAELNLRYYVRYGGERGVIFLREIVALRLVAWMARWVYNEPYCVAPFYGTIREDQAGVTAEYGLRWAGRTHILVVTAKKPAFRPAETTSEHFFKEHRWGFGVSRRGQGVRYEVVHPPWDVYAVQSYHIDLDWGAVYGPEWEFLSRQTPYSTVFAVGSAVQVFAQGALLPAAVAE